MSGAGCTLGRGQVGQKLFNMSVAEILGVLQVMEIDRLLNPVHIGFFCVAVVMLATDFIPHFLKKLGWIIRGLYISPIRVAPFVN